jgi:hypothetical protein
MFNEPGHEDTGPWQCPYCGIRLNAPLLLCPQCGANQLAAASRLAAAEEATPSERMRGMADRLRTQWNAPPGKPGGEAVYSSDYPSVDEESMARRRRVPRYAWGGLAALVFALSGYAIVHRDEWEPKLGVQVVVGSVMGSKGKDEALAARLPAAHGAPPIAAQSPHAKPTQTASNRAQQNVAQQKAPPAARLPATSAYAYARPDVARNLATARASLDKNSLWPARRAIMAALAEQPGNADAQQMRAELTEREAQRDALIGHARQCAHERQWACTRQEAGRAVSIDSSSLEAKHLLALSGGEHRARRTGWAWPWDNPTYAQDADARARQEPLFWHH